MLIPSEGNLFTAKPEPLSDLLLGIDRHKIALPDFQRPWVWNPDKVQELIVSVAYRYPAGSLLTMPVTMTETFALRAFEGAGLLAGVKPTLMVLDGQQRLTSLYQALLKPDGVEYEGRRYFFYLDVPVLMADPDGSIYEGEPFFQDALFHVMLDRSGKRIRYDGLTPRYDITSRKQELKAGTLPLWLVFDPNGELAEWREEYLTMLSGNDMTQYKALGKKWDALVRPWLDHVRTYPFPVVELRADMPLGAICHIFEKVNSTGVPLDVFDLCTAILWAQGFRLNKVWADTKSGLTPLLKMQPLYGTYFIQGLALLDSLDRKRANPTARIGVSCRKSDLMKLKRETVERWWPVLEEGYREAAKFMYEQGILSERILPYSTLIIPLTAIFAYLKHNKGAIAVGASYEKIARWYWCNVFGQRYSSNVETMAALDLEQVLEWLDGEAEPEAVRSFTFRADALLEVRSIRNAIYKGVLCLLTKQGARDFGGGTLLSTAYSFQSLLDHHHIFPTNALVRSEQYTVMADTIVNKTLISAESNRSISGKLPSEYISIWRQKLGSEMFDAILRSHAIDPDTLASDDWRAFILDRRERLRSLIAAACGGGIQLFTDSEEELEPEFVEDTVPDESDGSDEVVVV